jgi:hypothetical protein
MASTVASIILLIQAYVHRVAGWFLIRFIQGVLETLCRHSLYSIISSKHMHKLVFFMNCGTAAGFFLMCYSEAFSFLFTITGILLNLSHMSLVFHGDYHTARTISLNQKETKSWQDIFRKDGFLFTSLLLASVLLATFSTILPITLKNHGFHNIDILQIMFIGSLGNTLIQTINYYMRNILGNTHYIKTLVYILLFSYGSTALAITYLPILTGLFIFFIIGLHSSLHNSLISLMKEGINIDSDLELRNAMNQINNFGAILAAIIALMFIEAFPKYGVFILWSVSVLLIKVLLRYIKKTS